ncbi:MAG: right-handed parallel beta-helix repeat-containing protein [Candidatus Thermoplasmatota archaeon]
MKRKYLGFALFLIILGASIEITIYAQAEKNTTTRVVVGKTSEYLYQSIQDAINYAPPGSTIYISSGIYNEALMITKPLTIIGENKDNTILASTSEKNSYALQVTANTVVINQLSITNQGTGLYATGIKITGSHTLLEHCSFYNTPIGIALWSSDNIIRSCSFQNCSDEGIALLGSNIQPVTNNQILNCVFINNCDGIELQHSFNTYISTCSFLMNTHAGIDCIGTGNSKITINQCIFTENPVFGIYLSGSSYCEIISCSFKQSNLKIIRSFNTMISACTFDKEPETCESVTMMHCTYYGEPKSTLPEQNSKNSFGYQEKINLYSSRLPSKIMSKIKTFIQSIRIRLQRVTI